MRPEVFLTLNKQVSVLSKVQSGPLNKLWARSHIEDEGLCGVVDDLSEIAECVHMHTHMHVHMHMSIPHRG